MIINGYGKRLDIDLSTGRIVSRDIAPEFAREYIGGMGFGCKILYDEVGPEIDPFSPENVVIFANGPLTGTVAPCSGRTEITTKSPLTGHIGTGNTGGLWGARLKHAGFDLIVTRNRAKKPVYIWIDDDKVELREANDLWGKGTDETSDILCQELGGSSPSKISVMTIGPAGENLVRYACVINDYYHCAARSGAGAVMGSKNLKAIAVRGTGAVSIARPSEFREAAREARERFLAANEAYRMPGAPSDPRKRNFDRGALPGKNYQTGILPQWLETRTGAVQRQYFKKKAGVCYACPSMPCFDVAEVKEGKYAGLEVGGGLRSGFVHEFGAKLAIDNIPAILKGKQLCQQLGMDYVSATGSIAFAMELFQRGIITTNDTGGLHLSWGDEDSVMQLLQNIAKRDEFGDVLAEGSVRAAERIGRGANKYVLTIKGMEVTAPDPRAANKGFVFGALTNPRGGDNVKGTHGNMGAYNPNWWIDKFDIFDDWKEKMYFMPPEELDNTWEGKPALCKWFEDLYSVINALGICFTPSGFRLATGPTHFSKLFSACTGWDTTPQDIMKFGEKVFTLLKAYTIRQGLTRKADTWPDRFFEEPLPEGPSEGAVLSRDEFDHLMDEYYELRGWDNRTGLPTEQKLNELGLYDIAKELSQLGKLPINTGGKDS